MKKSLFNYNAEENMYIAGDLISYTDGSEKFFIDLFNSINIADIDNELVLQPYMKDWVTRYHLSHERTGVISPFRELCNLEGSILEIGAGMGAITRWLGKNFAHVDCIEGNLDRAKALRARTRNMANVDVYSGNVIKTNLNDSEYDLVTLIGVLEYIPYYSNDSTATSTVEFLNNIQKTLTDNGILIIAIENKFGLKYLSGCVEDHNATLYSGIMNYPFKSARTFGRNELESLIRKSGFENVQFYHVYPDYKMPSSVFRECDEIYDLNPEIFWPQQIRDNVPRHHLLLEPLAMESIVKEKMNHFFSNSFIALCSKSADVNLKTDWIFQKWSDHAFKPYHQHSVTILPDKNGGYDVVKQRLNNVEYGNSLFSMRLMNKKYVHGYPVVLEAYKALLARDDGKSIIALSSEIMRELLNVSLGKDKDGYDLVNGNFFDFTFWNLIRKNGKLIYFDDKWNYKQPLPVDFIMFRNMIHILGRCDDYAIVNNRSNFTASIMQTLFPNFTQNRLSYLAGLEKLALDSLL